MRSMERQLEERPVKFASMLERLLSSPGAVGSRKKLADALGVNEASISHYIRGRTRPSFDALVGIARFFNVSLDYLVFGERPQEAVVDDPVGVRAQVRRAFIEASDRAGRHLDLVTRISRRLQVEIEKAASEILEDPASLGPVGFVTDSEAIALESCTKHMRIMTRVFQSDVNEADRGTFFEVVMSNIRAGRTYEYLLYGNARHWQPQVSAYRALVEEAGISVEMAREQLLFRYLEEELPASLCIHYLDLPLVQRAEPILWERLRDGVSPDGVWAYISVERSDAQGGVVIEPMYLESALRQFSRDWGKAKPI